MTDLITEEEVERMREFASTPAFRRKPEQLLPPGTDGDR